METFADRVKYARKIRGLTTRGLAEKAKVSSGTISKWETSSAVPHSGSLLSLSHALDVSVEWLEYGRGEPPVSEPMFSRRVTSEFVTKYDIEGSERVTLSMLTGAVDSHDYQLFDRTVELLKKSEDHLTDARKAYRETRHLLDHLLTEVVLDELETLGYTSEVSRAEIIVTGPEGEFTVATHSDFVDLDALKPGKSKPLVMGMSPKFRAERNGSIHCWLLRRGGKYHVLVLPDSKVYRSIVRIVSPEDTAVPIHMIQFNKDEPKPIEDFLDRFDIQTYSWDDRSDSRIDGDFS